VIETDNRFEDREEHTPQEVRAGLTEYMKIGYVAHDLHDESASRTLEYACAWTSANADSNSLQIMTGQLQSSLSIWERKTTQLFFEPERRAIAISGTPKLASWKRETRTDPGQALSRAGRRETTGRIH